MYKTTTINSRIARKGLGVDFITAKGLKPGTVQFINLCRKKDRTHGLKSTQVTKLLMSNTYNDKSQNLSNNGSSHAKEQVIDVDFQKKPVAKSRFFENLSTQDFWQSQNFKKVVKEAEADRQKAIRERLKIVGTICLSLCIVLNITILASAFNATQVQTRGQITSGVSEKI